MHSSLKFIIEDIFDIIDRHPVVTGKISSGSLKVGDKVFLAGKTGLIAVTIVSIEKFKQAGLLVAQAGGGDVGLEISGVKVSDITYKDVITSDGVA